MQSSSQKLEETSLEVPSRQLKRSLVGEDVKFQDSAFFISMFDFALPGNDILTTDSIVTVNENNLPSETQDTYLQRK